MKEVTTCNTPSIDFLSHNTVCVLLAVGERDRLNSNMNGMCLCHYGRYFCVFEESALLTDGGFDSSGSVIASEL